MLLFIHSLLALRLNRPSSIAPSFIPFFFLLAASLTVSGCDLRLPGFTDDADESTRLSPRVVEPGQPVPKGGGHYKVGSPYRIHGKLYVPMEVTHYERTGVASWYGKLFHGRRTANGEVYDMEALTAAHPTLPLPSYVKVTNLRNGRALVLRVNDRGPYARGRLIDLSWAAASLLRMKKSGTAPVRVEYLGRAPINGNDHYERDFLARQNWAGPRVAYARSPGRAIDRQHQLRAQARNVVRDGKSPAMVASLDRGTREAPRRKFAAIPPIPAKRANAAKMRRIAVAGTPHPVTAAPEADEPQARPARQTGIPGMVVTNPETRTTFYVEAGAFNHKALADELARILGDIAPTHVEMQRRGSRDLHQIRLGPFRERTAADQAVAKLHSAGLTDARLSAHPET